ncbi:hypothetical protein [Kitasatospora sp. GP82]|uniref:hypothetical protein n=1 Tax=Kitasatospora sp. GP82 TaxID=3035089 RepID=UPI002475CFC8|nr:hypothetical protein [Kitasatospora sp. GP82]MDH6127393.1 hypothetical protein [Kitasatospora sp. GP82]
MKYGFRGLSAVTGAVVAGVLLASPAVAQGGMHTTGRADSAAPGLHSGHSAGPKDSKGSDRRCHKEERDFSSDVVDFGDFSDTEFRLAANGKGEAFLNDNRNPGVWVDVDVIPGAPKCVIDTDMSATESGANIPNKLFLDVETDEGAIYQAVCDITATPFNASNLAAACGSGFTLVPGTPV